MQEEVDFVREYDEAHDEATLAIFKNQRNHTEAITEKSIKPERFEHVFKGLLLNSKDEIVQKSWVCEASDLQIQENKSSDFLTRFCSESDDSILRLGLREYINSNLITDEELFALAAIGYGIDQDQEAFLASADSRFFKVFANTLQE